MARYGVQVVAHCRNKHIRTVVQDSLIMETVVMRVCYELVYCSIAN